MTTGWQAVEGVSEGWKRRSLQVASMRKWHISASGFIARFLVEHRGLVKLELDIPLFGTAHDESRQEVGPVTIVSFRYGFIFIKTRKTASTSLEVHLARYCAADDVITPVFPPVAGHQPRNCRGSDGHEIYVNHMPASRIRRLCPDHFDRSFRFCFERHPVDKCLSHFAMLLNSPAHRRRDSPRTWNEYLEQANFPVDTPLYTDADGCLLVDRIYRYEELPAAIDDIARQTGLPLRPLCVREKSGFRHSVPSLGEVMANPSQRTRIMAAFASTLRHVAYL